MAPEAVLEATRAIPWRARAGAARPAATAARLLPSAVVVGCAWAAAWAAGGSTAGADWLGYALLVAGALGVVLLADAAAAPSRAAAVAIAGLAALAAWAAIGSTWSPLPSSGREEALLTLLYALALATPLATLRTPAQRLAALVLAAGSLAGLAVATAVALIVSAHPTELYVEGRLDFPISYANAQAALYLLAFWPNLLLAAKRRLPLAARALAAGGAGALFAAALLTQSKGSLAGFAVSALAVLAVSPARLRLLLWLGIAVMPALGAWWPLTAPFRAQGTAAAGAAIRGAGTAVLVAAAVSAAAGVACALAERRLRLPPRTTRVAGLAVVAAAAVAILAGCGLFLARDNPVDAARTAWTTFKTPPLEETGSSHFSTLGSYRYDTWRVALHEFAAHPVAGIGTRGFSAAYLVERATNRTPAHAHSLWLEVLSEQGLVGFAFLAAGLGVPLVLAGRRARGRNLAATAALGAGAYFAVHASVDWIWSFPSVGLVLFLLLGIGVAETSGRWLPRRAGLTAGGVVLALGVLALAPSWLSSRLLERAAAAQDPAAAATDVRWARRLDPIAVDPLWAEARLAPTPAEALPPLRRAAAMEPRSVAAQYLLALGEKRAGDRARARAAVERALRLDPGDPLLLGLRNEISGS